MSAVDAALSSADGALLLALWEARGRELPMGELLKHVGGSQAKVQRVLDDLAARGCRIERSPGGVRLVTAGLACWRDLIASTARRDGRRLGRSAVVLPETASTNDAAWQVAGTQDSDGLVVLADYQAAGRGRLGRRWEAKAGQSVLMSVILHDMPAESLDRLTLLAGLATAEGLERAMREAGGGGGMPAGGRIGIHWPNDLLVGGRKLAGILVETRRLESARGRIDAVVVGIGVNVAQGPADFPADLASRGISLFEACGSLLDRLRLVLAVLAGLEEHLATADRPGDAWLDRWKERCDMLGRSLTVRSGAREITGQVLDVDPLQGLILRDERGGTHFLSARTSTLR